MDRTCAGHRVRPSTTGNLLIKTSWAAGAKGGKGGEGGNSERRGALVAGGVWTGWESTGRLRARRVEMVEKDGKGGIGM